MKLINMTVNGDKKVAYIPDGRVMLVDVLRDQFGLTGTKVGCGVGQCGACTVIMNGEPVTSCTVLAEKAEGSEVLTIEGLASGGQLHPIQEAFIKAGAVQCGFCTPGLIMRLYALFSKKPDADETSIKDALGKHICRCTGYESILEAALLAQKELKALV
jgi:carbon-monoxide dehydrogenase small subunit